MIKTIAIIFILITGLLCAEDKLRFIQITDTHFGAEENMNKNEKKDTLYRLTEIVKESNDLKMDISFVAFTGDITDNGFTDSEFIKKDLDIISQLKYPINYLPGNHEINPMHPDRIDAEAKAYTEKLGSMNYIKEYKGVVCIFFYDETLRTDVKVTGYDALKWLEDSLKNAGRKEVLIFTHSPPINRIENGVELETWNPQNKAALEKLVNDYNVKAIIAGHKHEDTFKWFGNVPVYASSAVIRYEGRQATFRIYEYEKGKLSYFTRYIQ